MRIISSQDLFESYMSDLDEAAVRVPRKVRGAKPSAAEWQRSRSYGGKIISGDENTGPKGYSARGVRDAPVAPGERPPSPQYRLNPRDRQSFRHHYEWSKKGYGRVGGAKGLPKPQAEEFELWVKSLVNEGYDLSDYTWEDAYEIYETYSDYLTVQAFLICEGYADSLQESDYMIENMDEDLIEEILENAYYDAEQIGRKLGTRQYKGKVGSKGNKLSRRAIKMVRNASPKDRKDVKRGLKTGFLLGADGPGI